MNVYKQLVFYKYKCTLYLIIIAFYYVKTNKEMFSNNYVHFCIGTKLSCVVFVFVKR